MEVEVEAIFTGHSDAIYNLQNGLLEHTFLSASADGFVTIWNTISNIFERPAAKTDFPIYAIKIIEEKNHLLIGDRSGNFYITDMLLQKPIKRLSLHTKPIFDIQYNSIKNEIWIASGDGSISIWNSEYELIKQIQLSDSNIRNIALNESNNMALISCSDYTIRTINTNTLEQIDILKSHANSVFCCAWMDDKSFVSGSRDAHLFCWKFIHNKWEAVQKIAAHNFTINDIKINLDKKIFATASRDKTIKIWDINTFQLLKVLDNKFINSHTHSVNKIMWQNNTTLLSCGDDKRIIKWKIF